MADIVIHPNLKLFSHSSLNTLHGCPRKYELYKLAPSDGVESDSSGDIHLDFGKVLGGAVQEYLITDSVEAAYFYAFKHWPLMLDDESGERAKKTFWHVLFAIDKFILVRKTAFANYKLAYLNNRPACELGISIDCGDGFYMRGFIDAVLIDTVKKKLVVFECKSTKSYNVDEASFKHSGQALGYSVTIDTIAPLLDFPVESSIKVIYPIYKTLGLDWEVMQFTKNMMQRAKWIKNLLIDKRHVIEFATDNYFPMHGEHCFSFFRQCPYFGTCELATEHLVGKSPEVKVEKPEKYDYHFKLSEIIERQILKTQQELEMVK